LLAFSLLCRGAVQGKAQGNHMQAGETRQRINYSSENFFPMVWKGKILCGIFFPVYVHPAGSAAMDQKKERRRKRMLFLGPFQPDLEEEFLTFLKNRKEEDPFSPFVVLVGSNLLALYLARRLVQRGLDHINIRFLTFIDLARVLASESLSREMRCPLPHFGERVCIAALAEQIQPDGYFHPIAGRKGFQRALEATFRDLRDGGIKELPLGGDRKAKELGSLYRSYCSQISKDYYDEPELFFRASQEGFLFAEIFNSNELAVYGFYDFTEGQRRLLQALANQVAVTAFMPWRETPGFSYASATLRWYQRAGFEIQAFQEPEINGAKSIEVLSRNIFRDVAEKKSFSPEEGDRAVLLIAAPGEAQEVREIAREVLRLAREEDVPFHEMAVLLRNRDLYGPLIQETFQSLNIPIYLQGGSPLSRSRVGKSVLLLLDLVDGNLKRSKVMEFLTFAPIAWTRFFREEPSPSQWDLISRQAGIVEGATQWEQKLAALMAQEKSQQPEGEERGATFLGTETERLQAFLKKFFPALAPFPKRSSWRGMVDATLQLVRNFFEESEDRKNLCQTLYALESLDALGREVSVHQFQEILSEALDEKPLRIGFFQGGGVCVSDLMTARGLAFHAVFIPGLVERAFPAPPRQDPLFLDHERQEVNQAFGEIGRIPLKRSRFQEEKLLFTLALGSAKEKLILSYPRLDPSSSRERIPSFFLLRTGEALSGKGMDYSSLEKLPQFRRVPLSRLSPEEPGKAVDEEEFDLAQVGKALKSGERGEVAYLKYLFPGFDRAEKLARLRWGFRIFTEYDGCLNSPRARKRLQERFALSGRILSPTKLEIYASCPFKYFLSEVLGLKSLPSPEEIWRIQPVDRGKIVHEILHQFYREAPKRNLGPLTPESLAVYWQIMHEVAAGVFTAAEKESLTGASLLWELDRQEILEDLHSFLQRELEEPQKMIPSHFEVRFGYEKEISQRNRSRESVSLTLEDRTSVSFRGRIDRIDFFPEGNGLRVIDYKTGSLPGQEDGFCGGTTLQLPLYLMAACRIWKEADVEKSWAEYCSVSRKGKFGRIPFRGENWTEKEKTLIRIIHTISQGIAEGTFFPFQEDARDCQYCDFQNLCEHGVGVLFQKKLKDPRSAAFLEMRKIR
jgi:ATP-dependent helicase/nuclease subunit B